MGSAAEIRREPENISPEDLYQHLAQKGPLYPGIATAKSNVELKDSDLYDPQLIAQGKEFVQRNYAAVVIVHLFVMMLGLGNRFIRFIILHNDGGYGGEEKREKPRRRYLSAIVRVMKFFEGDYDGMETSDQRAELFGLSPTKDLEAVRKIHYLLAKTHYLRPKPVLPQFNPGQEVILKAIRKEMEHIDMSVAPGYLQQLEDPAIPLSQFPLAVAVGSLMGLIGLLPQKLGVANLKGFRGYAHLWAIVGRQLGVEDQFNFAIHYKRTESLTPVKDLYEKFIITGFKVMDEASLIMLQDFIEGVADYNMIIRFLPALKYMLNVCGLEGRSLDPLMDWKDRLTYRIFMFNVNYLSQYRITRYILNFLAGLFLLYGSRKYLPAKFRKYK